MFRWTLKNEDTGDTFQLKTDPHGWKEISLEHKRSDRYDGIFLGSSQELSFHCKGGGKEFLDDVYDDKGSEGNVSLKVEFQCEGHFRELLKWQIFFPSLREEFKRKKLHTTVEVRKIGITQVVMSRDETDVDLLATESIGGVTLNPYTYAPYNLLLHSRIIFIESEWEAVNHNCCFRFPTTGLKELYIVPELTVIKGDVEETSDTEARCAYDTSFNGFLNNAPVIADLSNNDLIVQENTFTVEWNFSGNMTWTTRDVSIPESDCDPPTCGTQSISTKLIDTINPRLRVFFGNPEGSLEEACITQQSDENIKYIDLVSTNQFALTSNPLVKAFANSGTRNIILKPGDKVWFHWVIDINFLSGDGDLVLNFEYTDKTLNISSETEYETSEAGGVAIHEAWSRVAEGITDQTLAFKSEFFGRKNSQGLNYSANGYGSFTAILDGLRIRGYTKSANPILSDSQTKKGIITNLKDMYDSCNAIWGVCLLVETHQGIEVVRVEEKDYAYQNTEIYKISNIPNLEMSFQEEMAFSEVHIGYEKWRIESKGGLDEPNTQARWVFPKIKNIKNVKELISPYIGGMYPIEETRRKRPSISEDSQYDDDIFIIALNRATGISGQPTLLNSPEKDTGIQVTAGTLLAPQTAYNLRFNLFSNFDRVMNQFTTNLTKDAPQQINYSYLEGNGGMEFQYVELGTHPGDLNKLTSTNVQNTSIPNGRHQRQYPILLPELYTFSFPIPFSDYLNILNNPYGYISFSSTNKNHLKGYIKSLSYNIARQMADFSLIRKFE